jgi:hypothetical protein
MTLTLRCYSLSGSLTLHATVTARDLRTAWKLSRAELVGKPFAGTDTVAFVTPSPTTMPKGWRDRTKWATIRDRDGVEIGRAALCHADESTTFPPNRA